jgi:nitrate/nitrite transport system substrate-binding protein
MAYELGLFKKYGIDAIISKEASWAVIRDRLSLSENQASHLLLGMAYASTMGLLGSPVKPMITVTKCASAISSNGSARIRSCLRSSGG